MHCTPGRISNGNGNTRGQILEMKSLTSGGMYACVSWTLEKIIYCLGEVTQTVDSS